MYLKKEKSLPMENPHGAWLDNITVGQMDHTALNDKMVHSAVTLYLQKNEADHDWIFGDWVCWKGKKPVKMRKK